MLTKAERRVQRGRLFRHLDGLVTIPSAYVLYDKGVLDFIEEKGSVDISDLASEFNANEGYLNVALRVLSSQGWLDMEVNNQIDKVSYKLNQRSKIAFELVPHFKESFELLQLSEDFHPRRFEKIPFQKLVQIFRNFKNAYGIELSEEQQNRSVQEQVLAHIEGVILGPSIVHLGMSGMFHKYFMETSFKPEEFHEDPKSFEQLLDIFTYAGWFIKKNGTFRFTDTGLFFARRASAYGVTVSYIPTLRRLDELIFGDPLILQTNSPGEEEKHVDRAMNVWGSGGAHSTYFKIVDEIIRDIFNQPIDQQPKGILDMGCGNGAFIQHLFDVIEKQTERGKVLDEHPLILVGVDFNQTALKITKANLIQADIWAKVIWGDIGNPDQLASDLKENYDIDLGELLNVRTFLDHNRPWNQPENKNPKRVSRSTGAFATNGKRLSNNTVEESLLEHLKKWTPYVQKHGLLLIELHTLPPEITAANLGRTPATAYDATHGYSDQYIVELEVFKNIVREAGLLPVPSAFRKFPDSDLATVSINLLIGN